MNVLELDIDEMRVDVLKRMQMALKPFQDELAELDVMEAVLTKKEAEKGSQREKRAKLTGSVKPNGGAKFEGSRNYAGQSQGDIVKQILNREPGLDTGQIVERMRYNGYHFASKEPRASLATTLRGLVKKKVLKITGNGGSKDPYCYFLEAVQ